MPVSRQHHSRHFMVESADHLCWAKVGDVQLTGPEIIHETTKKISRSSGIQTELPEELSNVHNTFHVSNLKKCLSDESLVIPMKELRLDDKTLNFVEEPVEIMDREIRNVEGIVDINELFRKLKFVCHWVDSFKNLKWSNVPGIKLSLFSKSDDSFTSLQALLNLHYFLSGFMDYFWSCKLNISNFSPANRRILPMVLSLDVFFFECFILGFENL
ncbi:hypothetical protein Tco_0798633 [Tanacetum coccineum]